jgi:hypothetical protein
MAISAYWDVHLYCECPHGGCNKFVDLLEHPEFWCRPLKIGEIGTANSTDIKIECPECRREFTVTCQQGKP